MVRLAAPALAEECLVLMVTWTDWFLASRYFSDDGDATKAAMGLMAYLMWMIPGLFSVVGISATALIARSVGAANFDGARTVANQAYAVGMLFSIVLTGLVWQFGLPFIHMMQLEGQSANYAHQYLQIVTPVIPMIMCAQIGAACLRGAGDTFSGFAVKLIVVLVNVVVSTLLVTGWGLFPKLGWQGIAIGTATGYTVGGVFLTGLLIMGRGGLTLRWKTMSPDFTTLRRLFRIGLPGAFDTATLLFSQLLFLSLINSLGKAAAAAHGLAVQIEACAFLPGAAFQAAAATMAGQYLGALRPARATRSVLTCLLAGGTIMVSMSILVYFFGIQIASAFTNDPTDPTTIKVAELLKIVAVALPSLAVVMIVSGGFRGAGDTAWPFYITAIGFFLIRIPLAVLLSFEQIAVPLIDVSVAGFGWGVVGCWYAMAIDLVARSVLTGFRFVHGGWRRGDV